MFWNYSFISFVSLSPSPSFNLFLPLSVHNSTPPHHTPHTAFGSQFTRQLVCHIGRNELPRNTLSDSQRVSEPPFSDQYKKYILISEIGRRSILSDSANLAQRRTHPKKKYKIKIRETNKSVLITN